MRSTTVRWRQLRKLLCRATSADNLRARAGMPFVRTRKRARAGSEIVQTHYAQLIVDAQAAQRALVKLSKKSSHERVVAEIAQRKAMAISTLLGDVTRLSEGTLVDKMHLRLWGRRHTLLIRRLDALRETLAADHYWLILADESRTTRPPSDNCRPAISASDDVRGR